ncbi:uncharacterized protein crybg2 [Xyrichtys novacula]|uniref:Uncharacterized protein crybg2 n=1 Tax=Xyrichtys novacula TaxID=13765 RepID=A0AAV1HB11_XYRNO|nr:uncharacterized protein crybg2 [Xyrichtys novacula]
MAKSPSRKSLKSLFSRSEANLRDSAEKDADKNEGEKKRFRFFRLRRKTHTGSATEKAANETQQVLHSPVSPTKEDGDTWDENKIWHNKKVSLYATAPRTKGKELSYSDMDLRKPKRFSTFNFGLRKKKKKPEENLSKSAFGLHSTGIEELEEPSPDLGQMETQAVAKQISMSQPELNSKKKFDIPSPPPVATNQSESQFPIPEPLQSSPVTNGQPEAKQALTNGGSVLDVHAEPLRAPLASMPELQLENLDLLEEKENIPVNNHTPKSDSNSPALMTQTENTPAVDKQTAPTLHTSPPPVLLDSELKAAVVDLVSASNGLDDNGALQHTKPGDSVHQEVAVPVNEICVSETIRSVTATSAVCSENIPPPANQNEVYGALYDSLFPQSFTSEVMSSLQNPQPQTRTEIRLSTTSEHVLVKSFDERNVMCSNSYSVSYSELKSDSTHLIQASAPPASDYVTSQGTDTQVTDPKRRAILVKELVTDETSSNPVRASPGLEKMDLGKDLEIKMETTKTLCNASSGHLSAYEELLSPTHCSVGSDDGSAVEIYYSAEEDNMQDSGDERVEVSKTVKEVVEVLAASPQQKEITETDSSKRDEEITRVVIVKVKNERSNEDVSSPTEVYQQCSETWTTDAKTQEKEVTVTTFTEVLSEDISKQCEIEERKLSQTDEGGPRVVIVKTRETNDQESEVISSKTEVYHQILETQTLGSLKNDDAKIQEKVEETTTITEVAKELVEYVGLGEEILKQDDIAERKLSQTEEGGQRVVIIKMHSVESSDETKDDNLSRSEVYQQILETEVVETHKDNDETIAEKEIVSEVFPEVEEFVGLIEEKVEERHSSQSDEGGQRVVIIKMHSVESSDEKNEETISRTEVYQQVVETQVVETLISNETRVEEKENAAEVLPEVKEVVELLDELQKQEDTAERHSSQSDEGGQRVVIIKMHSVESSDEKNEETISRTEVYQQVVETQVIETLESNETRIEKKETATEVLPEVVEEVKELVEYIGLPEEETPIEGGQRVLIVKMQSVESNDEKNEDTSSQTEVEQLLRGQNLETLATEILQDDVTNIQEKETATEASPEVVKEVVQLLDEISTQKEIAEKEVKRDEDEIRVVIIQTENKGGDKDTTEVIVTQTEELQQLKDESPVTMTSETHEIVEEVKELIENIGQEEIIEKEANKRDEGIIEKVERVLVRTEVIQHETPALEKEEAAATIRDVEEVKQVVELLEELSEQGEITEKDMSNKVEEKKEVLNQTVVTHVKLQSSETVTTQEKEAAVTVSPDAAEEVKQVVELVEELEEMVEAKKEETSAQDEVQRLQSSEVRTIQSIESNETKIQVEKIAPTATPLVEEKGQEELLATPVGQVKTLVVCDFAPPSSEPHGPREGSEGNLTKEFETEDHLDAEQQLPSRETQYPADKEISSSEDIHAASGNTRTAEVEITPLFREAAEQVSLLEEANKQVEVSAETSSTTTTSAVTDTPAVEEVVTVALTVLQSDATEIEHNRAPQAETEWADKVTQSSEGTRTVQEQVVVELSALIEDTHLQPAETTTGLNEGSLTADQPVSENQPPEADQELDDKMNSGYSSLSTKLSFKTSSPPKEDESRYRVHKMSLISDSDSRESSQDSAVDSVKTISTVTESNGSDLDSEYRWRNRFEGVSQFKPHTTEDFSLSESLSYSDTFSSPSSLSSLSSSSALPEATAYKHADNAFPSSSSSPASEEHIILTSRVSDRSEVYLSRESELPADEWRRGLEEREEPAAPAGEKERGGESERFKSSWEAHQSPVTSSFSATQTSYDKTDSFQEEDNDSAHFTGVFKATLVELVPDLTPPAPSTPPASPETESPQCEMDSLVDTLKSMGPAMRLRGIGPRPPVPVLMSSLPPIVEDAPSLVPSLDVRDSISSPEKKIEVAGKPAESQNGAYALPADLGLKRNAARDSRSPLELMKQNQQEQLVNLPLRASATNSITMRMSSDSSPEDLKPSLLNGNAGLQSPGSTSRLDSSVIFSSYRAGSIDQKQENRQTHRQLFRTGSLPETGLSNDRMSKAANDFTDLSSGADPSGSRFDRFAFLLNSSSSTSGSLTGAEDQNMRMSRPPQLGGSPTSSNSPNRLLSPTGSIDLQRSLTNQDSPISLFGQNQNQGMGMGMGVGTSPFLQRSFSSEGTMGVQQTPLFNSVQAGSQFQSQEQERNILSKYRAFPDAYLTKEKEHGKLNPRPGKMYIFDRPGMCGQRIEVRSDVIDATPWELQETISIRVVRGGWVLYEKPNFKGEKVALDEGDIELTYPFGPPEEQLQNGQQEGEKQNGEQNGEASEAQAETKPARKFVIGSLRRAVRDYSVPEISLFPEENAEGKKVTFRDTSDDARIFGFPVKANSVIINAGLWLVYAHPFFQGVPRVLEVGGYPNPAAWGVENPYVGSLHPLKVGEPRVENVSEPKLVIYEKAYFTGKSRTITTNTKDFMTRVERQQSAFMYCVGSLKVLGGIWVGYEKEGYRGHQYLLEEGEYQDWRVWGGCDSELRSVRVIRADLTEPLMVMFEQPEEDQEGMQEENTFEVSEAIPDVELFEYKTSTRSIQVLSGAWVAYSHVDYSGHQYILEKGFYNNCADWGSKDNRICSVQPILLAPSDGPRVGTQVILYTEPDFKGECHVFDQNQEALSEKLLTKSCRVSGASWVFYEDKKFTGNLYVLSEGDYPNLTSMGCQPGSPIRSVKTVPLTFSVPSISLFGMECLEGREITMETEIINMVEEGFNNHILSIRINSGSWVICEHSNYRGRQFLLEPIEITNWPKFSSLQSVGSMYPIRQKRHFFRIKNTEKGHFLSIQGGVEEMKSGRVVVTPEVEGISDIWFFQDGFIKSKMSQTMSLQVMGNIEPAAKVVLWTETRQPLQTWTAKMAGPITSLTFPGMVLDIKGGKTYDKDHVVIMPESDERPSQQWEIELL